MKKLTFLLVCQLCSLFCIAQNTVLLKNTSTNILVKKSDAANVYSFSAVPIVFKLTGKPADTTIEKKLFIKTYNSGIKPKFVSGADTTSFIVVKIPPGQYNPSGETKEYKISLVIRYNLPASELKDPEHVLITANDEEYADLIFSADTSKSKSVAVAIKPNNIYVVAGDTLIYPVIEDNTLLYKENKIQVTLSIDTTKGKMTVADRVVTFKVRNSAFKIEQPLTVVKLKLKEKDIDSLNRGKPITDSITLKPFILSKLDKPADVYISTERNDSTNYRVRISNQRPFNTSNQFWIELGTNFDLVDGIEANNLYGGVIMFVKDIAGKKENRRWSFTGGVYESKSISSSSTSDSGFVYKDASSLKLAANGKYPYYRTRGPIKSTTEVKSIGLVFSPFFRLTKEMSETEGFHLYASVYLEMLWQRVKTRNDYTGTTLDSTLYETNESSIFYNHNFKEDELSADYRSHYFGAGLPIYIKHKNYNFYLSSVVGATTQEFVAVQETRKPRPGHYLLDENPTKRRERLSTNIVYTPKHPWNAFYLFNFRLNEDYTGITFSGEVRGFFIKNSKPIISLALSKKFNLEDVFKAIVAPFTPGKSK